MNLRNDSMTSTPHGRLSDLLSLKWNERGELNAMDRMHLLEVLRNVLSDDLCRPHLDGSSSPGVNDGTT